MGKRSRLRGNPRGSRLGVLVFAADSPAVLLLGLLEDCGYMARGAFIADYPLRLLGLGGKSFVPLFMGFGCSVPALMSTRTLHAGREKKICAAVIPFMSCSAKMPVYAMLISAFFPNVRWVAVILIYSLGIACACAGSLILKNGFSGATSRRLSLNCPNTVCRPCARRFAMCATGCANS